MPCNPKIEAVYREPSIGPRSTIRRETAQWHVTVSNTGTESAEVNVTITLHQPVLGGGPEIEYELIGNIPLLSTDGDLGHVNVMENLSVFSAGSIGVTVCCTPVASTGTVAQETYNVRLVG